MVDHAQSIQVHGADDNIYNTEIVEEFKRLPGIPRFRLGHQDIPGHVPLNEICLLESTNIPNETLRCTFASIDCCHLGVLDSINEDPQLILITRTPLFSDMLKLGKLVEKESGITVYKYGAASGFTSGVLIDVERPDDSLYVFILKVKWRSLGEPFAVAGDSGSLVWAKDGETIIPLGMHYGSEEMTSYSLSLQSFCQNISDLLDADLFFCVPDECGSDAVYDFPPIEH